MLSWLDFLIRFYCTYIKHNIREKLSKNLLHGTFLFTFITVAYFSKENRFVVDLNR